MNVTVEQLMAQARTLPQAQPVKLLKQLVAIVAEPVAAPQKRSILKFDGIAAHLADEENPRDYLRRLRSGE